MKLSDIHIRKLCSLVKDKGITVRRENLSRGFGFRVKSGNCELSGNKLLFIDKRLPLPQQLTTMGDFFTENGISLTTTEIDFLPKSYRNLVA